MKIAFLFKRDSHFKAVKSTALRVCAQYNCEPTYIGIESEYVPDSILDAIIYIDKESLSQLADYDFVIACLGGYLLNRVIDALRRTNVKVISIFPGIVSHYQLDAFISRLNADQVWINSKADFELYNRICLLFKRPNNSILYGMSWLDLESYTAKNGSTLQDEEAIFFEQTEILSSTESKQQFTKILEKIVISNPKIKFKYKIRDNSTDEYFALLRRRLSQFENVNVVEKLTYIDISQAKYYLSVSSSSLIEGIVYGKSSYIIDKDLLDFDSKEFYRNSNIELREPFLANLSTSLNTKWYEQRVFLPLSSVALPSIHKKCSFTTIKNRNYNSIKLMIFSLAFFYPKFMPLVFNRSRLEAFQKSLEYLSKHSYE